MRVLVAGATGAVGTVLVPALREAGLQATPHVRPQTAQRHPFGKDPEALVCDLADATALDRGMTACDSVVCLVGTMRDRFRAGDTYETSDYLPVVQLIESAKRVPARQPRHFVLDGIGCSCSSRFTNRSTTLRTKSTCSCSSRCRSLNSLLASRSPNSPATRTSRSHPAVSASSAVSSAWKS